MWFYLYFQYILKTYGEKTVNLSIREYLNKIENRITFKIKTGYYLKLLTLKTVKLLGSIKSKTNKDKNGENIPHLEIAEVLLINGNIVNINFQRNSRVLYTFVPSKLFGQLLDISLKKKLFLKTVKSEFS